MGNFIMHIFKSDPCNQEASDIPRTFDDRIRSVDFILAYEKSKVNEPTEAEEKRTIFERNLENEGLHLERDQTEPIHFVKIHAPVLVLRTYAEILKMKFPLKNRIKGQDDIDIEVSKLRDKISKFFKPIFERRTEDNVVSNISGENEENKKDSSKLKCEFSRKYEDFFDTESADFFDVTARNLIINYILERQPFICENSDSTEIAHNSGIDKLIKDGVYNSSYPLHDEEASKNLIQKRATISKWIESQPLDEINKYFGPKVALYFAWLGFYTYMLIPMSICGLLYLTYGLVTWNKSVISDEICHDNKRTIMCPQCDRNCDFWLLEHTCKSAEINYLLDNKLTVFYALLMSVWSMCYLEFWKRYASVFIYRWGLHDFSEQIEHPRPQYLEKIANLRKTKESEKKPTHIAQDVPFWSVKFLPSLTSYSVMILFICMSIIAICSVIIYRMAQKASSSILVNEDSMHYKVMVLPLTAGIIDVIVISLLDYAYSALAVYLTNLEYCRTQTDYDESLTIKNYIFQFVNYYSSLFYIAFFKGKFVGYPGEYNLIFGFRQEECNPGGCLMELCMQLVIIMVGKQIVASVVEMSKPKLMKIYRNISAKLAWDKSCCAENPEPRNQWAKDYALEPCKHFSLFEEYLEMVRQYGFITLFGLAFPLTPLLALINNIMEVRLDAIKMLKLMRRPVAQRASDIGVWYYIMTIVTKIGVASSAVIIAFSTNLIPKMIYKMNTKDYSLKGYLNFTLSYFDTKDFEIKPILKHGLYSNTTTCRYSDFRNPPWDENRYDRPVIFWKILMARLAFIVIFQNVVGVLQTVLAWAIPDIPRTLRKRIKAEEFLMREHIIAHEKKSGGNAQKLLTERGKRQERDSTIINIGMDEKGNNGELHELSEMGESSQLHNENNEDNEAIANVNESTM